MRILAGALVLPLLLAGCAGRPGTATTYGPAGLLGGYREKMIEPGVWQVTGASNGIAEQGFGRNMAVYRAAELMKSGGFSHFQVLDQKGKSQSIGISGSSLRHAGEDLTLTVRGVSDPAEPLQCRAKEPKACMTLNVDTIMTSIGPLLTFRKAKQPAQN